jgi:RHS repeat-associated protein
MTTSRLISLLTIVGLTVPAMFAGDAPAGGSNEPGENAHAGCNNGGDTGDNNCPPKGRSQFEHLSGIYIHDAPIYQVDPASGLAGCVPCGDTPSSARPSGLPSLTLARFYRSRNGGFLGSLGKNHYLNTDLQVRLDWNTGGPVTLRVFEPYRLTYKRYLAETGNGDTQIDGILQDPTRLSRHARLLDADGNLTAQGPLVRTVVLTDTDGTAWHFEVFGLSSAQTTRNARLARVVERTGVVRLSVDYVHPATAAISVLGNDAARWWLMTSLTAADGTRAQVTYDLSRKRGGRFAVSRFDLPNSSSTTFAYTSEDLTGITNPDGSPTSFAVSYDTRLQKIKTIISDPAAAPGHQFKTVWWSGTTYTYTNTGVTVGQPEGQLARIDDGAGKTALAMWYDPVVVDHASMPYIWTPESGLIRYTVTSAAVSKTTRAVAPDFRLGDNPFTADFREVHTYVPNAAAELIPEEVDVLGRTIRRTFDPTSRKVTQLIDEAGRVSTAAYNQWATPTTETDPSNRTTTYTYDAVGNLTSRSIDGSTWTWQYDSRGLVTAAIDANGNRTDYAYSPEGWLVQMVEPADVIGGPRPTRTYTYDTAGRMIRTADPEGRTVDFTYDARNRVIRKTYADASFETVDYGTGREAGLVAKTRDRDGYLTEYTYDAAGRKARTVVAGGLKEEVCEYLPGSLDLKTACTVDGDTTVTTYDARGRVVAVSSQPRTGAGNALTTSQSLDALGRATVTTDPYGRRTLVAYDAADRPFRTIQELVPGGVTLPPALAPGLQFPGLSIGIAPRVFGSATWSGTTATVTGVGRDIWGYSDQFQYLSQPLTGDMTFTARITAQELPNGWSKSGIMLRSSLSPEAAYLFLLRSSNGITVQARSADGATATSLIGSSAASLPLWLRVSVSGTAATVQRSANGTTWTTVVTSSFTITPASRVGLAVTSTVENATATTQFDQVSCSNGLSLESTTIGIPYTQIGVDDQVAGTVVVRSASGDIWNTSDSFHFARQTFPGSMLTARLASVTQPTGWAKAGLMIRASDSPSAPYVFLLRHSGGIKVQGRLGEGASAKDLGTGISLAAPVWMRLGQRSGLVVAEVSADGLLWTTLYKAPFPVPADAKVGFAVSSLDPTKLNTATFSDVAWSASTLAPARLDALWSESLSALPRVLTPNPAYAITDTGYLPTDEVALVKDGRGIEQARDYDGQGRLTLVTEAFGTPLAATTAFGYDAQGNRIVVTDMRSVSTVTTYTGRNLVATVTEAAGTDEATVVDQLTYTPTGKVKTHTDANGNTTTYAYGVCCDRLKSITDPAGFQTLFSYSPAGDRLTLTDGNGLTTTTAYDGLHRPVSVTDAQGLTTAMTYLTDATALGAGVSGLVLGADANGSAIIVTNPNGEATTQIRDGVGRLVRTIDPLGHATTTVHDALSASLLVTRVINPLGHTVAQHADARGSVRVQVDAIGATATMAFDAAGNLVSHRDAVGVGVDVVIDARGRTVARTDTTGVTSTTLYDVVNRVIASTDALGQTETMEYDLRHRKVATVDRIGARTKFEYDAVGNLTRIEDAEGGETLYTYNSRNLLTEEVFPEGQQGRTRKMYAYDGGRRLVSRHTGIGVQGSFTVGKPVEGTTYAYDQSNRLTTRGYDDGLADTFGYDPAHRLTSADSARYQTQVDRSYDADGRLIGETQTQAGVGSWAVGYAYDAANRQTAVVYPDGSRAERDFDPRAQLSSVSFAGALVASRTWDAAGRLAQTTYGNGVVEDRAYTPGDHTVATIKATGPGGAAVTDFTYTYDALKRKTAEIDPILAGQTFGYDAQSRLTVWTATGGVLPAGPSAQTWDLSPVGNWNATSIDGVSTTRAHTAVHEIASIGQTSLAYDFKGNLAIDDRGQRYTWDPENRMTAAWVPAGPRSATDSRPAMGADARYVYDALGRRVAKVVNGMRTVFVHDGAQVVTERIAKDPGAPAPEAAWNKPTTGGLLDGMSTTGIPTAGQVLRINFQPAGTSVPAGFLADTGAASATRGALHFGWSWEQSHEADITHLAPSPEWDTFIETTASGAAWVIDLPNGTYPIAIVSGEAAFDGRTNAWILDGGAGPTVLLDQDPGAGDYPGDFDVWTTTVTVSNGRLRIRASGVSVRPSLCFLEIAAAGSAVPANAQGYGNYLAAQQVPTEAGLVDAEMASVDITKHFVYSTDYIDEPFLYTVNGAKQYIHQNHLYSAVAQTNAAGIVSERYGYGSYGVQSIISPAEDIIKASLFTAPIGFCGFMNDNESGVQFARNRVYSSLLGRFISRDPLGYIDGFGLYNSYFVPNDLDPFGLAIAGGFGGLMPGDPGDIGGDGPKTKRDPCNEEDDFGWEDAGDDWEFPGLPPNVPVDPGPGAEDEPEDNDPYTLRRRHCMGLARSMGLKGGAIGEFVVKCAGAAPDDPRFRDDWVDYGDEASGFKDFRDGLNALKNGDLSGLALVGASLPGPGKILKGAKAAKNLADDLGDAASGGMTSRAARRQAMREEDIPTSQQPISQSRNDSGREYQYEVPAPGGGTQTKSVQQQTLDSSHPGQGHWEAGSVKVDPLTGETRVNQYGRPKLTNDKSKVDYDK